ncbi:MAG TPA: hypothetical protein DCR59_02500 [Dehalococcoidia bacterium]|nr:hypothetical protein [Dehalococcoidia bacterium]
MNIDVYSVSDCRILIDRINKTLNTLKPNVLKNIKLYPHSCQRSDSDILEGLSKAILSRQATWSSIQNILQPLKIDLCNYNINTVATLTDSYMTSLYTKYKSQVKARFLEDELFSIRDNAKIFQHIIIKHGSVCNLISSHLNNSAYDNANNCYVRAKADSLIKCFTDPISNYKLRNVRLSICCEFFNNIGIDEFKPDAHTIRFFNKINLDQTKIKVSQRQKDVRQIGITIADTLTESRKYIDSVIWIFCAEYQGAICTKSKPQCSQCYLKTQEPQLCKGN